VPRTRTRRAGRRRSVARRRHATGCPTGSRPRIHRRWPGHLDPLP
jgi:hypothetical protein